MAKGGSFMVEIMEGIELDFEDTQKDKFLTFSVETENYGLDIKHVTEIIGIQGITQIPHQPIYIKGVINLRGKIIPTMDIRLRFNKEEDHMMIEHVLLYSILKTLMLALLLIVYWKF